MTGLMEVTKCLGCGELAYGPGLCPDCTRLDEIYESRRMARQKLISEMPRTDVGVVAYEPVRYQHMGPALGILFGVVAITPFLLWATVHFGKLAILYLCGAQ